MVSPAVPAAGLCPPEGGHGFVPCPLSLVPSDHLKLANRSRRASVSSTDAVGLMLIARARNPVTCATAKLTPWRLRRGSTPGIGRAKPDARNTAVPRTSTTRVLVAWTRPVDLHRDHARQAARQPLNTLIVPRCDDGDASGARPLDRVAERCCVIGGRGPKAQVDDVHARLYGPIDCREQRRGGRRQPRAEDPHRIAVRRWCLLLDGCHYRGPVANAVCVIGRDTPAGVDGDAPGHTADMRMGRVDTTVDHRDADLASRPQRRRRHCSGPFRRHAARERAPRNGCPESPVPPGVPAPPAARRPAPARGRRGSPRRIGA